MMLSKNKIKLINSLVHKKYRDLHGLFIAEGEKILREILSTGYKVRLLILTESLLQTIPEELIESAHEFMKVDNREISKLSFLSTASKGLALVEKPEITFDKEELQNTLTLILDQLQDPGNLGTIIRIADWFGIKNIICSSDCVDLYNPKVIQSTMGSFLKVKIHYTKLQEVLPEFSTRNDFPIYGTYLKGKNVYHETLSQRGFIVIGNESRGISRQLDPFITHRINIPSFPGENNPIDSLNASMACAIICSEFRRRST